MSEFDQFVKRELGIKFYARYTDDFIILGNGPEYFRKLILLMQNFLRTNLGLDLHPDKIVIRRLKYGVDFLGYMLLPYYKVLRTKTKKRMFRKLKEKLEQYRQGVIDDSSFNQSLQSYLGILSHASTHKLSQEIRNQIWF